MRKPTGSVLITGANGFVGRHLTRRLVSQNIPVKLVVREAARLPAAWRNNSNITVHELGDLGACADGELAGALAGVDAIVHLAGISASRGLDLHEYQKQNAEVTERLCLQAENSDVSAFIYMSSIFAVSGSAHAGIISDETSAEPKTEYGRSKLAGELYVNKLARKGIFSVSLRPPLVIAPDSGGNWKQLMRLSASGIPLPFASLDNRRTYCGIETLVDAIMVLVLQNWPASKSGSYVLAEKGAVSLAETLRLLRSGMSVPRRLYHCPSFVFGLLSGVPGLGARLQSLAGDCEVDARRFYETFKFEPENELTDLIYRCGKEYARQQRRETEEMM